MLRQVQACSTVAKTSVSLCQTFFELKLLIKGFLLAGDGRYCKTKGLETCLRTDDADVPNGGISDDSFTTDDEDTAAVSGKQMWTMSFEWQDESAADATDTLTSFEESTDFGRSPHSGHETLTSSTTDSKSEAAEPSPTDSDRDWVQPWSASPVSTAPTVGQDHNQSYHASKENQPELKVEPMSDEHKTAILGKRQAVVSAAWYLDA